MIIQQIPKIYLWLIRDVPASTKAMTRRGSAGRNVI